MYAEPPTYMVACLDAYVDGYGGYAAAAIACLETYMAQKGTLPDARKSLCYCCCSLVDESIPNECMHGVAVGAKRKNLK